MNQVSKALFTIIAIWCIVVGCFNQTIAIVDDLPWVAAALVGTDVEAFNPVLAILAHWIGMFLITAGLGIGLIVWKIPDSLWSMIAASVLAIGTVGAQSFSVLSLGVFGPMFYVLLLVPAIAVVAAVSGYVGLGGEENDA